MPPEIFLGIPVAFDLVTHALHDDHFLDEIKSLNGCIGVVLLGNGFGAAEGPVTGDQEL